MTFDLLAAVRCPDPVPGYVPKEFFSPTAITLYRACPSAWARRYLEGRREREFTWDEVRGIPEPAAAPKNASAVAKEQAKELKRAWNKIRRPSFGKAGHSFLEAWYRGEAVDWGSDVGKVVWAGVHLLPDPATPGLVVESEGEIDIRPPSSAWKRSASGTFRLRPDWPNFTGKRDHLAYWDKPDRLYGTNEYTLRDYKFTSSFDWAKTAEEMREDPQVLLYSYDVIARHGLEDLPVEWIYFRTEETPKARAVRSVVTRAEAERCTIELAETALEMRDKMRAYVAGKLRIVDMPKDVSHCPAYGGCAMHTSKGGPCDARVSPGKAMRQAAELDAKIKARKQAAKEQERRDMIDFKAQKEKREAEKKAAAAANGGAAAESKPAADAALAGNVAEAEAKAKEPVQTTAAPADAGASEAASKATTKLKENKAASKAKPATTADLAGVGDCNVGVMLADGLNITFPVDLGTDLGKRIVKAARAFAALSAALNGEG